MGRDSERVKLKSRHGHRRKGNIMEDEEVIRANCQDEDSEAFQTKKGGVIKSNRSPKSHASTRRDAYVMTDYNSKLSSQNYDGRCERYDVGKAAGLVDVADEDFDGLKRTVNPNQTSARQLVGCDDEKEKQALARINKLHRQLKAQEEWEKLAHQQAQAVDWPVNQTHMPSWAYEKYQESECEETHKSLQNITESGGKDRCSNLQSNMDLRDRKRPRRAQILAENVGEFNQDAQQKSEIGKKHKSKRGGKDRGLKNDYTDTERYLESTESEVRSREDELWSPEEKVLVACVDGILAIPLDPQRCSRKLPIDTEDESDEEEPISVPTHSKSRANPHQKRRKRDTIRRLEVRLYSPRQNHSQDDDYIYENKEQELGDGMRELETLKRNKKRAKADCGGSLHSQCKRVESPPSSTSSNLLKSSDGDRSQGSKRKTKLKQVSNKFKNKTHNANVHDGVSSKIPLEVLGRNEDSSESRLGENTPKDVSQYTAHSVESNSFLLDPTSPRGSPPVLQSHTSHLAIQDVHMGPAVEDTSLEEEPIPMPELEDRRRFVVTKDKASARIWSTSGYRKMSKNRRPGRNNDDFHVYIGENEKNEDEDEDGDEDLERVTPKNSSLDDECDLIVVAETFSQDDDSEDKEERTTQRSLVDAINHRSGTGHEVLNSVRDSRRDPGHKHMNKPKNTQVPLSSVCTPGGNKTSNVLRVKVKKKHTKPLDADSIEKINSTLTEDNDAINQVRSHKISNTPSPPSACIPPKLTTFPTDGVWMTKVKKFLTDRPSMFSLSDFEEGTGSKGKDEIKMTLHDDDDSAVSVSIESPPNDTVKEETLKTSDAEWKKAVHGNLPSAAPRPESPPDEATKGGKKTQESFSPTVFQGRGQRNAAGDFLRNDSPKGVVSKQTLSRSPSIVKSKRQFTPTKDRPKVETKDHSTNKDNTSSGRTLCIQSSDELQKNGDDSENSVECEGPSFTVEKSESQLSEGMSLQLSPQIRSRVPGVHLEKGAKKKPSATVRSPSTSTERDRRRSVSKRAPTRADAEAQGKTCSFSLFKPCEHVHRTPCQFGPYKPCVHDECEVVEEQQSCANTKIDTFVGIPQETRLTKPKEEAIFKECKYDRYHPCEHGDTACSVSHTSGHRSNREFKKASMSKGKLPSFNYVSKALQEKYTVHSPCTFDRYKPCLHEECLGHEKDARKLAGVSLLAHATVNNGKKSAKGSHEEIKCRFSPYTPCFHDENTLKNSKVNKAVGRMVRMSSDKSTPAPVNLSASRDEDKACGVSCSFSPYRPCFCPNAMEKLKTEKAQSLNENEKLNVPQLLSSSNGEDKVIPGADVIDRRKQSVKQTTGLRRNKRNLNENWHKDAKGSPLTPSSADESEDEDPTLLDTERGSFHLEPSSPDSEPSSGTSLVSRLTRAWFSSTRAQVANIAPQHRVLGIKPQAQTEYGPFPSTNPEKSMEGSARKSNSFDAATVEAIAATAVAARIGSVKQHQSGDAQVEVSPRRSATPGRNENCSKKKQSNTSVSDNSLKEDCVCWAHGTYELSLAESKTGQTYDVDSSVLEPSSMVSPTQLGPEPCVAVDGLQQKLTATRQLWRPGDALPEDFLVLTSNLLPLSGAGGDGSLSRDARKGESFVKEVPSADALPVHFPDVAMLNRQTALQDQLLKKDEDKLGRAKTEVTLCNSILGEMAPTEHCYGTTAPTQQHPTFSLHEHMAQAYQQDSSVVQEVRNKSDNPAFINVSRTVKRVFPESAMRRTGLSDNRPRVRDQDDQSVKIGSYTSQDGELGETEFTSRGDVSADPLGRFQRPRPYISLVNDGRKVTQRLAFTVPTKNSGKDDCIHRGKRNFLNAKHLLMLSDCSDAHVGEQPISEDDPKIMAASTSKTSVPCGDSQYSPTRLSVNQTSGEIDLSCNDGSQHKSSRGDLGKPLPESLGQHEVNTVTQDERVPPPGLSPLLGEGAFKNLVTLDLLKNDEATFSKNSLHRWVLGEGQNNLYSGTYNLCCNIVSLLGAELAPGEMTNEKFAHTPDAGDDKVLNLHGCGDGIAHTEALKASVISVSACKGGSSNGEGAPCTYPIKPIGSSVSTCTIETSSVDGSNSNQHLDIIDGKITACNIRHENVEKTADIAISSSSPAENGSYGLPSSDSGLVRDHADHSDTKDDTAFRGKDKEEEEEGLSEDDSEDFEDDDDSDDGSEGDDDDEESEDEADSGEEKTEYSESQDDGYSEEEKEEDDKDNE